MTQSFERGPAPMSVRKAEGLARAGTLGTAGKALAGELDRLRRVEAAVRAVLANDGDVAQVRAVLAIEDQLRYALGGVR